MYLSFSSFFLFNFFICFCEISISVFLLFPLFLLETADSSGADFSGTCFSGATFSGTGLSGAAGLSRVNLSGVEVESDSYSNPSLFSIFLYFLKFC